MKEMDLILGRYADTELASLNGAVLDAYEALLEENDNDLKGKLLGGDALGCEFLF